MGSPYKLSWQSYGYHRNRYENQPGILKALMDYSGNLQVTSKIGTTKILTGYFGYLMVGGTTDMKISLQQTARCTETVLVVQTLFDQQLISVKSIVENHHRIGWVRQQR